MESILARALEYTLSRWLKSFSREQFKLQGRSVLLSNLDINGDALHASVGLPPALNVAQAKVGRLEIKLPSVSYVQTEPIIIQIDKLDLVLEENSDSESDKATPSFQPSSTSAKSSGYGFADKIADGMTIQVGQVNLMLETRGGAGGQGGATWTPPMASITIRNLLLFTTNEKWEFVNLKEARDFSCDKKCIYVFKKLQWESLSVDLLPHPNMFLDEHLTRGGVGSNKRDDDGAKRLFFGGERFLDGISGDAYITIQRTEQNNPLGLEVQLHIMEAVCPSLSEPGLRAFLRFMTGLYVCLNRGDVDPKAKQRLNEAAGCSLVSIIVDHIFLCIRDAEFRLELLMQSLCFSRASVSWGDKTKNMTRVMVGGLFLRDTFSQPPCTLVQPSMQLDRQEATVPNFAAENVWPKIYPLGEQSWQVCDAVPLLHIFSVQLKPSPSPPLFASETVIRCLPIMINLQEESCLRIASFLADGVVVSPGAVLSDSSINSVQFTLEEFDLIVPLVAGNSSSNSFAGARLHVEDLFLSQSPKLKFKLLNLEKDPACFCLWEDQPIDSSMRKWMTGASRISLSLETEGNLLKCQDSPDWSGGMWRCVELHGALFEVAMATADGCPLITVPPPGGIVRVGVACEQYLSNTSVEQLFFVLDLYTYFGNVSEKISKVGKAKSPRKSEESSSGGLLDVVPSDTAVNLVVNSLQLKFLDSSSKGIEGMPLVLFGGDNLFINVAHRTLGGAVVVSSSLRWDGVQIDCVDTDGTLLHSNLSEAHLGNGSMSPVDVYPQMRAVFWIEKGRVRQNGYDSPVPFLEISTTHVIPFKAQDSECHTLSISAKVAGIRLGGGMNYTEALLHRFGILGPDGGPGDGLSKGLKNLSEGPLAKLLKASPHVKMDQEENGGSDEGNFDMGMPDDMELFIELNDWLFALEGELEMAEYRQSGGDINVEREERCWHTTFQSLQIKASSQTENTEKTALAKKYPLELVTVSVDGLQAIKPQVRSQTSQANGDTSKHVSASSRNGGGISLEAHLVLAEDEETMDMTNWVVENLKFAVKEPIEAVATKEELEYLVLLCRSEFDAMGRIAAGILRVLKLEKSIGRSTIDQLSNLGSDSLDKIVTPEKLSRRSSVSSIGYTPRANLTNGGNQCMESTVSLLETAIADSQDVCAALVSECYGSGLPTKHLKDIEQLDQKLQKMKILLARLRTDMLMM
ncbi:UHRF1-binding protein 1-like [Nymphaea thermarum]|nr:UHRF1-binding protein 1-like [Nymphaea thermarum]